MLGKLAVPGGPRLRLSAVPGGPRRCVEPGQTRRRKAAGKENDRPTRGSVAMVRSQLEAAQKAIVLQEANIAQQTELDSLKALRGSVVGEGVRLGVSGE